MKTIILTIFAICYTHVLYAATNSGQWDEVVGKTVYDTAGVKVGTVIDTVVDIEHGRYLGMLVHTGLFKPSKIVPLLALTKGNKPRSFNLNLSKEEFLKAPTFELSKKVGPPQTSKVLEVYKYYNQVPNFSTNDADTANHLGYVINSYIL